MKRIINEALRIAIIPWRVPKSAFISVAGFFLSIIVFTQFLTSCHKPCNEPNYTFNVSAFFFPEKDTIDIGDTLWIKSIIPQLQRDVHSQKEINFSNAQNLGTTVIISDITKFRNPGRGAIDSFNFLKVFGNIYTEKGTDTLGVKQLSYVQTDSSYELKVGLVALKSGKYIFTIPDNPSVYRKGMEKCGLATFYILNQNINRHLYLFEDALGPLSEYDKAHSYCIKVR
jgi:hypothetical protein